MSSRHRLAAFTSLAILLAACGSSAATPTTAPTTAPTAAPTAATTPSPTPAATPTATPAPSASSTAGRTGYIEVPDGKFAMTLADGWMEISLSDADVEAIANAFPANSDFAKVLKDQLPKLLAAGVKLWAYDLQTEAPGTNLNVIVQSSPQISLPVLKSVAQQGISQLSGIEGTPKVSDVTVDGVDGVKITYRLTQAMADGTSVTVSGTQVYVSTSTDVYIFTFTIMKGGDDADVDPMINSVKFLS